MTNKSDRICGNCKANMYWKQATLRVNLENGCSKQSSIFECQVCSRKEEVVLFYQKTQYGEMATGSETLVHWPGLSLDKAMNVLKNFAKRIDKDEC